MTIEEQLGIRSWEECDFGLGFLSIKFLNAKLEDNNMFNLPSDVDYQYIWIIYDKMAIEVKGPNIKHRFYMNVGLTKFL
ncbi:hypothetical protein KNT81_gp202 [Proteus phage phiP4-3]|uniref:Uncharacterized protein n=1 Tax=Proteus phage phiP4-3 TaxID=2065203 RepID=A0A2I6PFQ6_9CAUD|nr:hypothetical protein KNT81_gp202 [Proteus phage phiP4-3]AUM58569.1 hypothetical protein phiP43_211 [Proteus phage phiP4-3]AZV01192.1 hypothetical protein vBSdyM006_055 [Shigella phage vB_SdyM_006]